MLGISAATIKPISLNTEKLRRLLVDIRKRQLPYDLCLTEDIRGPGGGIYVVAHTLVSTRPITWFESRNPAPDRMPTFMEVVLVGPDRAPGPLGKVNARAAAVWDRATGPDHRCYVAGGRFKNMLSWEVTGFLGEEEYARIFGPYDRELQKRLG